MTLPDLTTTNSSAPRPVREIGGVTVLNTDIGYDTDDFVTAVIAAHLVPKGRLVVVTSDEVGGLRARLARRVLDSLGRGDVPVIEGIDLGGARRFLPDPDQHVPDYVAPSLSERERRVAAMVDALSDVIQAAEGAVRWVGCGPLSELTALLLSAPDYAEQLIVTQMGGWLNFYRDPELASHNFRMNPVAAGLALRILPTPKLVLSEHTNHPDIRVTADWALLHALEADSAPDWARLLGIHFRRWFDRLTRQGPAAVVPGSWMHDPLTLSAALDYPFVEFTDETIRIGDDARLYRDPYGRPIRISARVDYIGFLDWMHEAVITW